MILFPAGIVTTTSTGSLGLLFEANNGCDRKAIHTTLVSKTDSNFQVTRKKASVYHVFSYTYENIWAREFLQIERFFKSVNGKLTSFYLVDFSHMQRCVMVDNGATRTVTKGGSISVLRTNDFTTITDDGGNYACVWNPTTSSFIIGAISSISVDVSITFPEATAIGALGSGITVSSGIVVAPVYKTFFAEDQLQFEPGEFVPSDDSDGGFLYSGSIGFIQVGVN